MKRTLAFIFSLILAVSVCGQTPPPAAVKPNTDPKTLYEAIRIHPKIELTRFWEANVRWQISIKQKSA